MQSNPITRQEYVRRLLDAYRTTPTTTGSVRPADRRLAVQLYEQGIPLTTIENAFVLAAARRLFRQENALPLVPVHSLHYFRAVIDEILALPVGQDYFHYLRAKIAKMTKAEH